MRKKIQKVTVSPADANEISIDATVAAVFNQKKKNNEQH